MAGGKPAKNKVLEKLKWDKDASRESPLPSPLSPPEGQMEGPPAGPPEASIYIQSESRTADTREGGRPQTPDGSPDEENSPPARITQRPDQMTEQIGGVREGRKELPRDWRKTNGLRILWERLG
ncbi:hypothetical protein E2C01_035228 [Portunus trituberculatus]|uniref:Uncharacterized protein n=1 Tax=Portunus trituberculatus TaxID=210409 RepID=A0A5B7F7X8_PORTR|nr:hypothetical protein [Portunus trituberculatus]